MDSSSVPYSKGFVTKVAGHLSVHAKPTLHGIGGYTAEALYLGLIKLFHEPKPKHLLVEALMCRVLSDSYFLMGTKNVFVRYGYVNKIIVSK